MHLSVLQLASISYFIGFIFLFIIRSYDKYDKEPLWRLAVFSFLGGIVAVGVSSVLYAFVHPKLNLTDAVLKVGTVEEFSKLLTLFLLYKIIKKEFDEIVDGIIYVAAVSLGFSVIENIFYAQHAAFPLWLLFKRFLFATVGHISFSVYMGIAFYVHKKVKTNYAGLFLAFLLSTLAHGLYDGLLFNKNLTFLFLPLYFLLILFQFRLLKVSYAYSKMKEAFDLSNFKTLKNNVKTWHCCHCDQNDAKLVGYKNVDLLICHTCDHLMIPKPAFDRLLKFYRPKLNQKLFYQNLHGANEKVVVNQHETIIYNSSQKRFNADFVDLKNWFMNGNQSDLALYHNTLEGRIFYRLGFKYLS